MKQEGYIHRGKAQLRRLHPDVWEAAHPLHPINYLPPSPWRLRRRHSGDSTPLRSMVGFYALEYLLKLTQSSSALRETVALRESIANR